MLYQHLSVPIYSVWTRECAVNVPANDGPCFSGKDLARVYMDDFVIFLNNLEELLKHVSAVKSAIEKDEMRLNSAKFHPA